jgi:phage tail-like protein
LTGTPRRDHDPPPFSLREADAMNPAAATFFIVEAGLSRTGFERVHLPVLQRDTIRYRDGGDKADAVRKLPGLLNVGDAVLERGVVPADTELFQWLTDPAAARRDVVVTLLDATLAPLLRWTLRRTFPVGLEWSVLDAVHGTVLVERLRLAVEAVELHAA